MSNKVNEVIISKAIIETYTDKLLKGIDCDVAIVGGGPSGLVAAYYLGQKYNVSLFERKLSIGGGLWGGGMMFNKAVVQKEALSVLDDFDIKYEKYDDTHFIVDTVEMNGALVYKAAQHANIFNCIHVEDVMVKDDKMSGLVILWSPVEMVGMHVDPITVASKTVIDATGHDASVCTVFKKKGGDIEIKGERFMDASEGERGVIDNTREIYPNLFVSGMAVAAVHGQPRMGPIFGGMLLSGKKVSEQISSKLG